MLFNLYFDDENKLLTAHGMLVRVREGRAESESVFRVCDKSEETLTNGKVIRRMNFMKKYRHRGSSGPEQRVR